MGAAAAGVRADSSSDMPPPAMAIEAHAINASVVPIVRMAAECFIAGGAPRYQQ